MEIYRRTNRPLGRESDSLADKKDGDLAGLTERGRFRNNGDVFRRSLAGTREAGKIFETIRLVPLAKK